MDKILAVHRERVKNDARSVDQLIEKVAVSEENVGNSRGFTAAISAQTGLAVIAEIKRRSPSKGNLLPGLDPVKVAEMYQEGGAACLSVLTDQDFFAGSPDDLKTARRSVDVPVLRKDFTVGPTDVIDARLMGADAILLIVAALDDAELRDFFQLATEIGLDVLIETHDENEVERAMAVEPHLIGVNQRDLFTFNVDTNRAVRVRAMIGNSVVTVAESGVQGPADAETLHAAGYDAVLVGESVVTASDPAKAVASLREVN